MHNFYTTHFIDFIIQIFAALYLSSYFNKWYPPHLQVILFITAHLCNLLSVKVIFFQTTFHSSYQQSHYFSTDCTHLFQLMQVCNLGEKKNHHLWPLSCHCELYPCKLLNSTDYLSTQLLLIFFFYHQKNQICGKMELIVFYCFQLEVSLVARKYIMYSISLQLVYSCQY